MAADLEFRLPDIGEGVTEGEIVEWFVKPGSQVKEDDPMVEVMTDKATVTIGAPRDGTIVELRFEVGAIAKVGATLLTMNTGEDAPRSLQRRSSSPPAASAVGDIKESLPGTQLLAGSHAFAPPKTRNGNGNGHGNGRQASVRPAAAAQKLRLATSRPATTAVDYFEARPLATPATRRLAKELDVDLQRVKPTGAGGRVTKQDVRAMLGADIGSHDALEERKPLVGLRRVIAERMQHTVRTAAHFTFVEECDVTRLIDMRDSLQEKARARDLRLSFLPFIVRAVVAALKEHPQLNASIDERSNELVYKRYYHLGIATATDAGLVVPVLRNADELRLLDVAAEIERLAKAARAGTLKPEELRGSTFTITSLGKQSGLLATPILNHPEVGILGVHQIKERPVVRDGKIVVGHVMLLSLSFDHRVVDGHEGAAFAYNVIERLQNPALLFSECI